MFVFNLLILLFLFKSCPVLLSAATPRESDRHLTARSKINQGHSFDGHSDIVKIMGVFDESMAQKNKGKRIELLPECKVQASLAECEAVYIAREVEITENMQPYLKDAVIHLQAGCKISFDWNKLWYSKNSGLFSEAKAVYIEPGMEVDNSIAPYLIGSVVKLLPGSKVKAELRLAKAVYIESGMEVDSAIAPYLSLAFVYLCHGSKVTAPLDANIVYIGSGVEVNRSLANYLDYIEICLLEGSKVTSPLASADAVRTVYIGPGMEVDHSLASYLKGTRVKLYRGSKVTAPLDAAEVYIGFVSKSYRVPYLGGSIVQLLPGNTIKAPIVHIGPGMEVDHSLAPYLVSLSTIHLWAGSKLTAPLRGVIEANIHDGMEVDSFIVSNLPGAKFYLWKGSKITASLQGKSVYIDSGMEVDSSIVNYLVGADVYLRQGSVVKTSLSGIKVFIGANADERLNRKIDKELMQYLKGSHLTLEKGARIENEVVVKFSDFSSLNDKRTDVPAGDN